MIYDQIDAKVSEQIAPLEKQIAAIDAEVAQTEAAYKVEDSKKRESELRELAKTLHRSKREIDGLIETIKREVFKDLLAGEYGIKRDHPKFEKVFDLAWSYGHSSGYSEVESHFMDFVELVS
jgi:hypothetical protein